MKLSIIIIVKNDRSVEDTLRSLFSFKQPIGTEVIVVDGSKNKLIDIKKKYPQVNWFDFQSKSNAKVTIAEQRNTGLRLAKGNVIVFIDASCVPVKNWLNLLLKAHEKGEKIVAGPVIPSNSKVINNISARVNFDSKYINECPTANVLIDKVVLKSVGGFDENFEYGSDTDLMWRARKNGFRIYFEPRAIVTHDWGTYRQQLKRSYNYGKGRMRLYIKHRMGLLHMLTFDPILFFYPIFLFFSPISIIFPYYWLLLLVPLIKNYKSKPFHVLLQNTIYGFGGLVFLFSFSLRREKIIEA